MKFMGALTAAECTTVAAAMRAFYAALTLLTPSNVTYTWQQPAQVYSDAGVLTNEVTIPSLPAPQSATGTNSYAGGTGAVVFWNTGAINGGHKIRGRTYLVPLSSNTFGSGGTITTSAQNTINAAAAALIATVPNLAVNSRSLDQPDRGNQTVSVVSASLPNRSAVLRTRRG